MVYRLDRISRSVADFSSFMVMLRKSNTDFISIKDNFDTHASSGNAMMNMSATFSQFERIWATERLREYLIKGFTNINNHC